MANCGLCGKKIGLFDDPRYLTVNGKSLEICAPCHQLRNNLYAAYVKEDELAIGQMEVEARKKWSAYKNVDEILLAIKDAAYASVDPISRARRDMQRKKEETAKANREKAQQELAQYRADKYNNLVYVVSTQEKRLEVFSDKIIITNKKNFLNWLSGNVFEGEKTLYYVDCVGLQICDGAPGFLQLETASAEVDQNNLYENVFQWHQYTEEIAEVCDYIRMRMDEVKKLK